MCRNLVAGTAILLVAGTMLSAQETGDSEAAQAWETVRQSDASADVFEFIEQYPDSEFTKEAKALMIDLLWVELATNAPEAATEAPAEPEPAEPTVASVTFSAPLTQGAPEIVGRSLEELIAGNPLFPPVEGLPESFWKAQECSNCHEWQQSNLCDQANTYLTDAGSENLTKQHPYGGTFKQNLVVWANGGCE